MKLNSKSINYNVDTVLDLASIASPLVGDTVVVTEENRGGVFIYRADGDANDGTIFDSSSTGKWHRQYDGAVNVKWFGEDIQTTINNSSYININNSEYETETLFIPSDISINGESNSNTILKRTSNGNFISIGQDDNISISNLTLDLQKTINGYEGHGISGGGTNHKYNNITVKDYGSDGVGGGTGILISSTLESSNIRMRDCDFYPKQNVGISIGWLYDNTTTSFADSLYSYGVNSGIGYANELKNNSTYNIVSNLIAEYSNWALAYGQTTTGVDGADYNIASNILAKHTSCGYVVGEGNHNLLNGLLIDNTTRPDHETSTYAVSYAGGASNNVSLGVVSDGAYTSDVVISGQKNYTSIATYGTSSDIAQLTSGSFGNVVNVLHAGDKTSIFNINDSSGSGYKGIDGNVIYSNAYGQYLGSLSSTFDWRLSNTSPMFLSSSGFRMSDSTYAILSLGTAGNTGDAMGLNFATPTSGNRGAITFSLGATSADDYMNIRINGSSKFQFQSTWFIPSIDNTVSLGKSANRWSVVYASTGTINTSDAREKTFSDIPEIEMQVAKELKSLVRRFKFNDAIEAKGEDKARIHYGTSAQEVIAVFEKYGLDAFDYAMVCYDEWEEELEVKDEEGNITQPYRPAGNRYGIRYEELIMFMIGAM